jgi:SulP family sulfate permease
MLHAVFVLLFMLMAAPLAGRIPLASLAGLLAVVAWNMAEKAEIWELARSNKSDAVIIAATFLLVIFRDLTTGIVVGFALEGLVFIHRMSQSTGLDTGTDDIAADDTGTDDAVARLDRVVIRLSGPYFFGAAAQMGAALDRVSDRPRHFVLDLSHLNYLDSSGARSLELLAVKLRRKGGQMVLLGVRPEQRGILNRAGLVPPLALHIAALSELDSATH